MVWVGRVVAFGHFWFTGRCLTPVGLAEYLNSYPYTDPHPFILGIESATGGNRTHDLRITVGCGNDALTDCATAAAPPYLFLDTISTVP